MTQGDVPDFDPRKKHAAREHDREVRRAARPPELDAKRWRGLSKFEGKLRGTSGQVTIPVDDFLALMAAARRFAVVMGALADDTAPDDSGPVTPPEACPAVSVDDDDGGVNR